MCGSPSYHKSLHVPPSRTALAAAPRFKSGGRQTIFKKSRKRKNESKKLKTETLKFKKQKSMKTQNSKSQTLFAGVLVSVLGALRLAAQTTNSTPAAAAPVATPEQTFFQSVGGYLSSINYTNTFTNNVLEVSTGAGETGPILGNYVKAQHDAKRWDVSATVRNAGIAGVIESAEAGGGFKVIEAGDTALTVAVEGGWDWNKHAGLVEPQLVLRKKATKNTFFETGLSLPEWTTGAANKTPGFFIGTGFTY